jgi:hypothetical protein
MVFKRSAASGVRLRLIRVIRVEWRSYRRNPNKVTLIRGSSCLACALRQLVRLERVQPGRGRRRERG